MVADTAPGARRGGAPGPQWSAMVKPILGTRALACSPLFPTGHGVWTGSCVFWHPSLFQGTMPVKELREPQTLQLLLPPYPPSLL